MLDCKLRTGTSQRNKIEIKLLCLLLAVEVLEYILLVPAVKNDHFFHTSPEIHLPICYSSYSNHESLCNS